MVCCTIRIYSMSTLSARKIQTNTVLQKHLIYLLKKLFNLNEYFYKYKAAFSMPKYVGEG